MSDESGEIKAVSPAVEALKKQFEELETAAKPKGKGGRPRKAVREAVAKTAIAVAAEIEGAKPPVRPKDGRKQADPLTDAEKAYIRKNVGKPGVSDESMGRDLERHKLTIASYRKTLKLKNPTAGIKQKNDEEFKNQLSTAGSQDEKRALFRNQLLSSYRMARIRLVLNEADLQYLVDRWVEYHLQFKDMTPTEEDLIEKMIILDIRLNHNAKFLRDLHATTDALKLRIPMSDEMDPEDPQQMMILQTIQTYNGQEVELNKQYQLLLKEYQAIQQSLNATREQREASQKIGAVTFLDIVRKMNDDETKMKMGRTTELTKIAADRKRKSLSQPHKFIDGTVDIPILTSDTYQEATKSEEPDIKDIHKNE